MSLDKGMNTVLSEGVLINLEVRGASLQPVSEEFTGVSDIFLDYNLKDVLKNRLIFYLNHVPEMFEAIRSNDFRLVNIFLRKFQGQNCETIAFSCRSAVKALYEMSHKPTVLTL